MPKYRLQLIEIPKDTRTWFSWAKGGQLLCNLDVPEAQVLPLIASAVALLRDEADDLETKDV